MTQITVSEAIEMMKAENDESFISVGNANYTSRNGELFTITRTNNFASVADVEEVEADLEANLHFEDGVLDLRMNAGNEMDIQRAIIQPELKEELGYSKLVIFSASAKFTFEGTDPDIVRDSKNKVAYFAGGFGIMPTAVRAEQTFEKRDGTRVVKVQVFFGAMQL
jgi:hypothetical protein